MNLLNEMYPKNSTMKHRNIFHHRFFQFLISSCLCCCVCVLYDLYSRLSGFFLSVFVWIWISLYKKSVRERDESSYAICLSHDSKVKHYRIDILPSGNFAIQDGPKFESIIAVSDNFRFFFKIQFNFFWFNRKIPDLNFMNFIPIPHCFVILFFNFIWNPTHTHSENIVRIFPHKHAIWKSSNSYFILY